MRRKSSFEASFRLELQTLAVGIDVDRGLWTGTKGVGGIYCRRAQRLTIAICDKSDT